MSDLVTWLAAAPLGAVPILTAILGAVVAMLVTIITQWVLGRRARTDLLTKKLEELYLVLNEVSDHGVKRTEDARPLVSATVFTKPKIAGGIVERQGLDIHRKVFMLVRLYFPKLSTAHEAVGRCNRDVNVLSHEAETGPPLSEARLNQLSIIYRDSVVEMEEELILNRRILVKDHLFPVRYRREATQPTQPLRST